MRYSDTQILAFLNEAQGDAISTTLCIEKQYSFETVSGTTYYSMPDSFITVKRLISDDQRLDEKSPTKLDKEAAEWETVTGTPINFFINFSSRAKIGFYPVPDSTSSTTTISMEYYANADDMTSSSTPFNGITEFAAFHNMLSYYAAAQMLYIDGLVNMADRYMQRYIYFKEVFKGSCKARPSYMPKINMSPNR
ncbi:MAG: hypothetical protein U9R01_07835 [candidate division WOR-3 bacterium]|nr:hypothetical protein [candidate division WOR-3 bacterium]